MRYGHHLHTGLCEPEWKGRGRRPVPWCDRFFPKVEIKGENDCWPWKPALKSIADGKSRFYTSFNFTVSLPGYPRQMSPSRWLYTAEIEDPPEDYDVDHICELFYCVNIRHLQAILAEDNQGRLNVERGVYRRRTRDPHGRYAISGEEIRSTETMGRKSVKDMSRDELGKFVSKGGDAR